MHISANEQTYQVAQPTDTPTAPLTATPWGSPTPTAGGSSPNTTPTDPPFPLLITLVNGRFFPNPSNNGAFNATTATPPVFSQQFPVVGFNPPSNVSIGCTHTAYQETRPFTDVIPGTPGTPCVEQPAQFPRTGTPTVQAGVVGSPDPFHAVFTGQIDATGSGAATFNFWSDDGWALSIGPKVNGNGEQPSYVSGDFTPPTPNAGTPWPTGPFTQYRVVGRFDQVTGVTYRSVTVNFPASGYYPFELDYSECCGGQLSLLMGSSTGDPIPPGPTPVVELRAVAAIGQNPTSLVTPPAVPTPYKVLNLWAVGQSNSESFIQYGDPSNPSGVSWSTVNNVPNVGPLNGVTTAKRATDRWDAWAAGDSGILHYDTSTQPPRLWEIAVGATGANAVAARDVNEVWAVGNNSSIQKYNGTVWVAQTPSAVPTGVTFTGVALYAYDDTLNVHHKGLRAVGYRGAAVSHDRQPFFARMEDDSWTVATFSDAGPDAFLNTIDMFDKNYAWAMGAYVDTPAHYRALIYHWDGVAWNRVEASASVGGINPGVTYNELRSVWMTGGGDVWAVGRYSDAAESPPALATLRPYVLRWSDSNDRWVRVDTTLPGVGSQLLGITTIPNQGAVLTTTWAVGSYAATAGGTIPWIEEVKKAPLAPAHSTSYYETTLELNTNLPSSPFAQGCRAAQNREQGIMILDFGAPRNFGTAQNPQYGTLLTFTDKPASIVATTPSDPDITKASKQFIYGYGSCYVPGPLTQHLVLALGINNTSANLEGTPIPQAELTSGHAKAWANLVDDVYQYSKNYPGLIDRVSGAIDAEPNFVPYLDPVAGTRRFDTPANNSTYTWVSNFLPQKAQQVYYNFGSTDGYPGGAPGGGIAPAGTCCSGWTAEQLYKTSYGLGAAHVIPEIYKLPYSMSWHRVARWSYDNGQVYPLFFDGLMSDCRAVGSTGCTQLDPAIDPNGALTNFHFTNDQAWQVFWHQLNVDLKTSQNLPWSTDIRKNDQ